MTPTIASVLADLAPGPPGPRLREARDILADEQLLVSVDPSSLGVTVMDVVSAAGRAGELTLAKETSPHELLIRLGGTEHRADVRTEHGEVDLSLLTRFLTDVLAVGANGSGSRSVLRVTRGMAGDPCLVVADATERKGLEGLGFRFAGPGEAGPGALVDPEHHL